MTAEQLVEYGMVCGWTLARAHAKTGDSPQIAGYLGDDAEFDEAMVAFAEAYADQNAADYEEFKRAVNTGRLFAIPGI
jgi:NAD(P)H-dependent flavin oxidoreductase YrpB (nitropropane dioxygenase family)